MSYSLKNIIKGASALTSGQVLTKASAFLLLPLYTRFLTPADYGIVGYLQVVMQFLSVLLMFGLYGSQTRFYYDYKDDKEEVGQLLFSINVYLLFIVLSICTGLTFFGNHVYGLISTNADIPFSPYIIIVIWAVFFQIFNQLVTHFYLAQKNFKKCAALQYVDFLLATGCAILFIVYFRQGALGQLKGLLYGNCLFFSAFLLAICQKFQPQLFI